MSSQTPPRTSQTIQNENVNLQLKAGGLQYHIAQYKKDLDMVNDRMRDLAIEYNQVVAKEQADAALRKEIEESVKKQVTPPPAALTVVQETQTTDAPPEYKAPKTKKSKAKDQKPPNEVNQATTQSGSDAVPTQSQAGPDEQSHKKE